MSTPLYEEFEYKRDQVWDVMLLKYFKGAIDCYCPECGRESTFRGTTPQAPTDHIRKPQLESKRKSVGITTESPVLNNGVFEVTLQCSRNTSHLHNYLFLIQTKLIKVKAPKFTTEYSVTKIGQYPSFSDLNIYKVKKYKSVLSKQMLGELSRAIGLASHDVGVGSYVYLRRVFENLIEEAHQEAVNEKQWSEEKYQKSRMLEKIKILRHHLPTFLVDNPEMYGLLSKGIHELKETECLDHFDTLKIGIELILDEKLENKEKEKKITAAKSALQKAGQKVNEEKA
jgi:hypothetical protein